MKVIILFILFSMSLQAQSNFNIEAGYILDAEIGTYQGIHVNQSAYYLSMNTRIELFNFYDFRPYLGGDCTTYMLQQKNNPNTGLPSFFPIWVSYSFEGGLTFHNFSIFFKHNCSHPVNAMMSIQDQIIQQNTAYDKIGIKYSITW